MVSGIDDLSSLSIDELWALHEKVAKWLSDKLIAEWSRLEERLEKLNSVGFERADKRLVDSQAAKRRRKYPPVSPKYRNPKDPSETWAGRGKLPRWLVSELKAGKKMDDFLIDRAKREKTLARKKPAKF